VDVGLEIWDAWSSTSTGQGAGNGEYKGRHDLENRWSKFKQNYKGHRVTIASIYAHAKRCGWNDDRIPDVTGQNDFGNQQWRQFETSDQQGEANQQDEAGQNGPEHRYGEQPRKKGIATPFEAMDFTKIPKRQWLYGRHYVRKYATGTVAPGGGGKTALKIAEAVSMAIGCNLLDGSKPINRLRVWYWNGEDPLEEINRRIAAVCLRYQIEPKELAGSLFVDSGHDTPICLATENRGIVNFNQQVINSINETLELNKIDVFILDPFVSIHKVTENNNPLIDQVVKFLGVIANKQNCPIEIVHHVRKPSTGQNEITADDARGGGAIVNAVRSCQVLNRMSSKEAEQVRIQSDQRYRYFRIDSGKQNLAPPEKAKWRHLESIDLPNGDNVQVVEHWQFPEAREIATQEEKEIIRAIAQEGIYNRWDWRAKFWIGREVANRLGLDAQNGADRQDITAKLKVCRQFGIISVEARVDERRKRREFVVAGPGRGKAPPSHAEGQ
jgi:hypothetical protein